MKAHIGADVVIGLGAFGNWHHRQPVANDTTQALLKYCFYTAAALPSEAYWRRAPEARYERKKPA